MKNLDKANAWLQRAKSNMARAKAGRVSPDILYEDLCYDAQQAVEKALKSTRYHEICIRDIMRRPSRNSLRKGKL